VGLTDLVADELDAVRRRSLSLTDTLTPDELCEQQSPLMSPLVWDLAHVGNYEDQWLLRAVDERRGCRPDLDDLYDAFRHPRSTRSGLTLLPPDAARGYIAAVREQVLDVLERAPLDGERPLLRDGFVYGMVIQHEHQHDETMLATRQIMGAPAFWDGAPKPQVERPVVPTEVRLPGGEFTMGTDLDPWAYDNERPAHPVVLAPFWLDTALVTNADYIAFIDAGGYDDRRWWSDAGWSWRLEADLVAPGFWEPDAATPLGWRVQRWGAWEPIAGDEPVQHVCWHEANAYAAWRGRRLPTEAEWEFAAAGCDRDAANLGQRHPGPSPLGAHPLGASRWGVHQLLGDVWEWTASSFGAYPGFASFPYREYSEVFFGDEYKVLRGGSWATHPTAIRPTFRNWDYPIRRQIFAGFRTARDA
jgi:iron(II)-dependent oxidoreductase